MEMLPVELQRDSPFFEEFVPVTVSSSPDISKLTTLTFRIIPGSKAIALAGQTEKVIHFEVAL